jgi:hypothetical protein
LLKLFFGLSLFYRLATRRPTRFSEVWLAALYTAEAEVCSALADTIPSPITKES